MLPDHLTCVSQDWKREKGTAAAQRLEETPLIPFFFLWSSLGSALHQGHLWFLLGVGCCRRADPCAGTARQDLACRVVYPEEVSFRETRSLGWDLFGGFCLRMGWVMSGK